MMWTSQCWPTISADRRIAFALILLFAAFVQVFAFTTSRCESGYQDAVPSLYDEADPFLAAIAAAEQAKPRHLRLTSLTVPHHLLAADLIGKGFRLVDPERIKTVVILSPDHFKKARLPFATTRQDFQTVFGTVTTNRADVDRLLGSSALVEESSLFTKEHGIQVLLPFIKHFLPQAQIVPVAVAIRSRRPQWDRMAARVVAR